MDRFEVGNVRANSISLLAIYIPVWIDLKILLAVDCKTCIVNLHSSMDRFEDEDKFGKRYEYVNLHSSMDRFEAEPC